MGLYILILLGKKGATIFPSWSLTIVPQCVCVCIRIHYYIYVCMDYKKKKKKKSTKDLLISECAQNYTHNAILCSTTYIANLVGLKSFTNIWMCPKLFFSARSKSWMQNDNMLSTTGYNGFCLHWLP